MFGRSPARVGAGAATRNNAPSRRRIEAFMAVRLAGRIEGGMAESPRVGGEMQGGREDFPGRSRPPSIQARDCQVAGLRLVWKTESTRTRDASSR